MTLSRSAFHQQYRQQAQAKAAELFAHKPVLQGAWLNWVAEQLYGLKPAEYANMVRRELERLQSASHA